MIDESKKVGAFQSFIFRNNRQSCQLITENCQLKTAALPH